MRKLVFLLSTITILIAGDKVLKSMQPYLDKKVFYEVTNDCFQIDDTLFYQIAFIDGSGSYGFGIESELKSKDLKEIADSVMARAYRQRNNK